MPKFTAVANLIYYCGVNDKHIEEQFESSDLEISVSGREMKIVFNDDNLEVAEKNAEKLFERITKWLSFTMDILVTSTGIVSIKDDNGHGLLNKTLEISYNIELSKTVLDKGIKSLKNNLPLFLETKPEIDLALEYISLGNNLLSKNIPFGFRYAFLEFARAVEVILGEWEKHKCEKVLVDRGFDWLIDDIIWLLTARGNSNVAHPPIFGQKRYAGRDEAIRARDIAKSLVLEETGYQT